MPLSDFTKAARDCRNFADLMTPTQQAKLLGRVGRAAKLTFDTAVKHTPAADGSLADARLSAHGHPSMKTGWDKVDIVGRVIVEGSGFTVEPAPRAKGPLRVLESGRKAYDVGAKRVSGVRLSKKTNDYALKYRKVKRVSGATKGKRTWTIARDAMAKRSPRLYADEIHDLMVKSFPKG